MAMTSNLYLRRSVNHRYLVAMLVMLMTLVFSPCLNAAANTDAPKPLRIHMISGSGEYQSEPSLKAWAAKLESQYNVVCTLSLGKDGGSEIPNLDPIDQADLLVVFCRRVKVPEDQLAKLKKWCEDGKPVIGIRTASHGFQTWLEFDNEVLGGTYTGHGGREMMTNVPVESAKDHPILKGVGEWQQEDKLYTNPPKGGGKKGSEPVTIPEGVVTLLESKGNKPLHRTAWCYEYNKEKGGRSFYISPSYPHHFENENYLTLLKNAVEWTTRRTLTPKAAPAESGKQN